MFATTEEGEGGVPRNLDELFVAWYVLGRVKTRRPTQRGGKDRTRTSIATLSEFCDALVPVFFFEGGREEAKGRDWERIR